MTHRHYLYRVKGTGLVTGYIDDNSEFVDIQPTTALVTQASPKGPIEVTFIPQKGVDLSPQTFSATVAEKEPSDNPGEFFVTKVSVDTPGGKVEISVPDQSIVV